MLALRSYANDIDYIEKDLKNKKYWKIYVL